MPGRQLDDHGRRLKRLLEIDVTGDELSACPVPQLFRELDVQILVACPRPHLAVDADFRLPEQRLLNMDAPVVGNAPLDLQTLRAGEELGLDDRANADQDQER